MKRNQRYALRFQLLMSTFDSNSEIFAYLMQRDNEKSCSFMYVDDVVAQKVRRTTAYFYMRIKTVAYLICSVLAR